MEVDNANADDLQTYYELQKEVHRRHNLPARKLNTLEILHEMWNLLAPNGMMRMYKARFEGETVACAAVFRFGKSVFYRGGVSNEKGRTLSANTALQWKIICDAIQDGIGFYNIYNRQNAASITFRQNDETAKNEAVRLSIFGIVPSVTYNFKF